MPKHVAKWAKCALLIWRDTSFIFITKNEDNGLQIQAYNINKHECRAHNYSAAMLTEQKSAYRVKINVIQKVSHRYTFQIKISVCEHIGQSAGHGV